MSLKSACYLILFFFIFLTPLTAFATPPETPDTVTLQLKWRHQFQFAGYYAAIEKGYYTAAGLKVVLREGRPGLNIADELLTGRANYGVAMPDILLEQFARQQRPQIVALAAIFQHSPEALFVRRDSGITNPQDLIGKNVMLLPNGEFEIQAMLLSEGVKLTQIHIIPHTWNLNDLISGKVDAASGYLTDRPFILQKRGVAYSIIRPLTYGIDFYGDCLFTTKKEIHDHPQRVRNFLAASLRGWKYAMRHPNEISSLILKKYSTRLTKKALLYEAKTMQKLILPEFVAIGYMNPGRWQHIADTFVKLGLLKPNYSLKGLLYNPESRQGTDYTKIMRIIWIMLFVVIAITLAGIILLLFNRKLGREVAIRTRQLEQERQFTEAVLKTLPGAFYVFYVHEDEVRLIRWNKNFQQEAGCSDEEMAGRHPLDWFRGQGKEKIMKEMHHLFEKGEAAIEANVTFKRGEVPYYLTATILKTDGKMFVVGVGIDLTIRRQLEEQLRQAQKMESIGRLAGGVAHDFNNVLTTILGYSELLLADMTDDDPHREQIGIIHSAGEKAAALTRQLLALSRKQILEKKVVSINIIIDDLLKILGKMLGEDIVIKTFLRAKKGVIEADPGQIEQIIMNLSVNARDATPQGGEIMIETKDIIFDKKYAGSHLDIEAGPYVMLAVTDNGAGMDKEVMEHIFDPFFTTKEKDKGTGLGLATVYGIVKQHNGQIYVYSEMNKGTTFKIYFPASSKSLPADDYNNKAVPLSAGHETIMVVDDNSSIRKLIVDTLKPLGYKCLKASSGKEAIEIMRSHTEAVHLLLTDVVMPGMSGKQLSEIISAENPSMKTIFMSGYTENIITHHGVLDPGINYIPKPIMPIALTQKIRHILDS